MQREVDDDLAVLGINFEIIDLTVAVEASLNEYQK